VVLDRGSKVVAGLRSLGFFILGVGIGVWAVEWWNHGFTYAARHGVGFWFLACGFVIVEGISIAMKLGGDDGEGDDD
jgi:hypothetical protein